MQTRDEAELLQNVQHEFDDFHGFLNEWFPGHCARDDALFERRHAAHLSEDFAIVLPDGSLIERAPFIEYLRGLYGANPNFRKQIRKLELRGTDPGGLVLVTYQEWQKGASNTRPANHARMVSAALHPHPDDPARLQWLLIHETMAPGDVFAGDSFDF